MPRTKGRINYSQHESNTIVNKITSLLLSTPELVTLVKNTDQIFNDTSQENKARHIETITMATYIQDNEDLTKKIQAIYMEHGVEIEPSQAVTKVEAISARKNVVKTLLAH